MLLRRSYKEFPVEAEEIFSIKSEVLFFRAAASQNRAQQFRVQNLRASAAKDAADGCKRGDDEVLNSPYILRWLADAPE